ncbi:MAG: winged helix-turn-helix transcriptional regulator [Chloroflexi bacterium]|nr:winged helix-turn-helix transcriptional regulator [Chloroflexota bacterium]
MAAFLTPYKAIADGTRRQILDLLREESLTAGAIARRFPRMSRPAVSKHLAILRRSRLVVARKRGRERLYALRAAPLGRVDAWIRKYERYWDRHPQSLPGYLEAESKREGPDSES